MSRSLWWFTVIAAGIPLALVSGLAVRRGYRGGHRVVLATATLITAGLYVVFPLAFVPVGKPLTGLALWAHEHHVLGLAILLVPTVVLLVDELWRKDAVAELTQAQTAQRVWATPDADADTPSIRSLVSSLPRRTIIGCLLFVVVLVWMAGTNAAGLLLGLGILVICLAAFLWHRHRLQLQSVLRDLRPPEKS